MKEISLFILIGISLSIDAFSLALSIKHPSKYKYPIIIGIYHFIMPIIGYLINSNIIIKVVEKTNLITGIIFIYLGIKTIIELKEDNIKYVNNSYWYLGLLVSLDSLSVGIGLSSISNNIIKAALSFSLISFIISYIAVNIKSIISEKFNNIANYIAITILLSLGFVYLCK